MWILYAIVGGRKQGKQHRLAAVLTLFDEWQMIRE
jgi:hypothetical protein